MFTIEALNIVNLWYLDSIYDLVFDFVAFYIIAQFSEFFNAVYDNGRFKVFADMQLNPHAFRTPKIRVDANQEDIFAEFNKNAEKADKKISTKD